MLKRALIAIALSLIVWGCGTSGPHGTQSQTDQGEAPEIIDYHAAEVIRPGATWRVYLKAQDKDGDIRDIASVVTQRGTAGYPTSVTRISEEHSREVAGFLVLRTPATRDLMTDRLNLRVIVRDRQGNRSESVELPLRFGDVPPQEIPEKWEQFADQRLGVIQVSILPTLDRTRRRHL